MLVYLDFGNPYKEMLGQSHFEFHMERGSATVKEILDDFIVSHKEFEVNVSKRGYYSLEKSLLAVYAVNEAVASREQTIANGDKIKILFPLVGG
jgi:molybdopterin converting factor small subunit